MAPTLVNGDYVLAKKYRNGFVNGSIAVIQHPHLGTIIKRIQAINEAGKAFVSGDSLVSTETETISGIDKCLIKYQADWRISPEGLQKLKPLKVAGPKL